jgi:hypothetical protein
LSVLPKFLLAGPAVSVMLILCVSTAAAQSCPSPHTTTGCTPGASIDEEHGPYNIQQLVKDLGPSGFTTGVKAATRDPGASPSQLGAPPSNKVPRYSDIGPLQAFCRRDDHAFLPTGALAGIPCDTDTPDQTTDPRQFARSMFDHLDLPSLQLNMNPRRGMVAVPTWFWIEGYDGGVIGLVDNLQVSREECHREADRDEGGAARLDAGGSPVTHNECHTIIDTFTVEVRAWPKVFQWNFGDDQGKTVPCADTAAACPNGAGRPFTDPYTPSPIAHAYRWSSLGANGDADAYSIGLGITFGAQYRFSVNGGSRTGWEGLDDRDLSWSTRHQVQEAQAVLTRP